MEYIPGKPTYWIITRTNHAMPTPGNSFGANTPKTTSP
jgi:hypothetical protein